MLLIFSFCHLLLEDSHRGREKGEEGCASGFRARRLMHLYIGSVGCVGILLSLKGKGDVFMVCSPFIYSYISLASRVMNSKPFAGSFPCCYEFLWRVTNALVGLQPIVQQAFQQCHITALIFQTSCFPNWPSDS